VRKKNVILLISMFFLAGCSCNIKIDKNTKDQRKMNEVLKAADTVRNLHWISEFLEMSRAYFIDDIDPDSSEFKKMLSKGEDPEATGFIEEIDFDRRGEYKNFKSDLNIFSKLHSQDVDALQEVASAMPRFTSLAPIDTELDKESFFSWVFLCATYIRNDNLKIKNQPARPYMAKLINGLSLVKIIMQRKGAQGHGPDLPASTRFTPKEEEALVKLQTDLESSQDESLRNISVAIDRFRYISGEKTMPSAWRSALFEKWSGLFGQAIEKAKMKEKLAAGPLDRESRFE